LPLLHEAEQRRAELYEALFLLADAGSTETARRWQEAVWRLHEAVNGKRTVDQATFMVLFDAARVARNDFYVSARASLGITTQFAPSQEFSISPD